MLKRLFFLIVLLLGSCVEGRAQPLYYPSDAGLINVKSSPYNAVGDGVTDDTAALQAAFTAAATTANKFGWTEVLIPAGTYLVSSQISESSSTSFAKRMIIRGSGAGVTTIRLTNGASGFQIPTQPKAVISTCPGCSSDNLAFETQIDDLTVSVGYSNPGAIGIQILASNVGGLRNVNIVAPGAGQGTYGLDLSQSWPGPSLYDGVTITGFNIGAYLGNNNQYSVVFKDLTLIGQTGIGVYSSRLVFTIEGLYSLNTVPVVSITSQAFANISHANLVAPTPTTNQAILVAGGAGLHLTDVSIGPGYSPTVQTASQVSIGSGQNPCAVVYTISGTITYSTSCTPMNLPLVRPPIPAPDPAANWVGASAYTDAAINTALSTSGAKTVYLPNPYPTAGPAYAIDATMTIPATVDRIICFGSRLLPTGGFNAATPLFSVAARTTPLLIEDCGFDTGVTSGTVFVSATNIVGSIILRDNLVVYLSQLADVSATANSNSAMYLLNQEGGWLVDTGETLYGWQVDLEGSPTTPHLTNNGANIWIYGLKDEQAVSQVQTNSGGNTVISGGYLLNNQSTSSTLPMFDITTGGGTTCVDYVEGSNNSNAFTILMGNSSTGDVLTTVTGNPVTSIGHYFVNICGSQ